MSRTTWIAVVVFSMIMILGPVWRVCKVQPWAEDAGIGVQR